MPGFGVRDSLMTLSQGTVQERVDYAVLQLCILHFCSRCVLNICASDRVRCLEPQHTASACTNDGSTMPFTHVDNNVDILCLGSKLVITLQWVYDAYNS